MTFTNSSDESRLKSLRYSLIDAVFSSLMLGFCESYFMAYAVFLGANNMQVGLLGGLPYFIASFSFLFTVPILKYFRSRRTFVLTGAVVQALCFIPMVLLARFSSFRVETFMACICVYIFLGSVISPAWDSWMGDLVTESERGLYFGRRERLSALANLSALLVGGGILKFLKDAGHESLAFGVIFCLAMIARFISAGLLTLKYDEGQSKVNSMSTGLIKFVKEIKTSKHGRVALYNGLMTFGIFFSISYYPALMLKKYHFNYLTFMAVLTSLIIFKALAFPVWGKLCYRFGPRKMIRRSSFLMCFTTVPWIFFANPFTLIIAQAFGGIAEAGYELSIYNFLLNSTESEQRTEIFSYFAVFVGMAGLAGAVVGGIIFSIPWLGYPYETIFAVSALIRIVAFAVFEPSIEAAVDYANTPSQFGSGWFYISHDTSALAKRQHPRFRLPPTPVITVNVERAGGVHEKTAFQIYDISKGGCGLVAQVPAEQEFSVGSAVIVKFSIDDEEVLRCAAVARHCGVRPMGFFDKSEVYYLGIEFGDKTQNVMDALNIVIGSHYQVAAEKSA